MGIIVGAGILIPPRGTSSSTNMLRLWSILYVYCGMLSSLPVLVSCFVIQPQPQPSSPSSLPVVPVPWRSAFSAASISNSDSCPHYQHRGRGMTSAAASRLRLRASKKQVEEEQEGMKGDNSIRDNIDPLTKASWYAVEAFGKVFKQQGKAQRQNNKQKKTVFDFTQPPSSLEEAFERIKLDNERNYFLSGEVDEQAYAEDCVFADPFVSFAGRDRFVENLQNLGSFITAYDTRPLKYDVNEDLFEVDTKLMVKLELNLPWKPILAWPWGVKYMIDRDTNLITNHIESWDVSALDGVKQIFRKPTTTIKSKN
jgi:hypothetical protein